MTTVHFSIDDAVAILSIDLVDRPHNVLTALVLADLDQAIARLRDDDSLIGAVIVSGKPAGFLAGADLHDVLRRQDDGITAPQAAEWAAANAAVFRRLESCGKPIVAAIAGHALGGGLELALACHHRLALDDARIQIGLPEVTLGLLPGAGGTQRLPRLIGIENALPLLLEGRRLAPAAALAAGIVDGLHPDRPSLLDAACAWVRTRPPAIQPWDTKGFAVPGGAGPLAGHAARSFQATTSRLKATRSEYPAPRAILSAVYEGTQLAFDIGMRIEAKYFGTLMAGAVSANLIRSFVRQGEARKRRGATGGARPIERVAVIGAGMMGAGIANVCAAQGIRIALMDRTADAAERGMAQIRTYRLREIEKGLSTAERAQDIIARVTPVHEAQAIGDVDLVIEAVFEDRDVKSGIYQATEPYLAAGGILASNTSTLSITSLAATVEEPTRFIGMHFFSPVERMDLVEVIAGARTSPEVIAQAFAFIARLGKTPILVHDSPGFYTSRVFCSYIDEAMAMLAEGVSPILIENAARQAGFPAPPLAVADEVSLDLQTRVIQQAHRDGLDARFLRDHASAVVDRMTALGRLGRKVGAGFYDYGDAGKSLWNGLGDLFPVAARQPEAEDVAKRLLYIQALVSAQCLAEGVIDDEATADIGSISGIGYPAWTGGALSIISTVGPEAFAADCRRFAADVGARFDPAPIAMNAARVAADAARARSLAA